MPLEKQHRAEQARRDGLMLVMLGSVVLVLLGFVLRAVSPESMSDFKTPFYSARCMLQGCDPYDQGAVTQLYDRDALAATKSRNALAGSLLFKRPVSIPFLYPPTIFSVTAPLALLPYPLASLLWTVLLVVSLIACAYFMWEIGAKWSPLVAAGLLAFLLSNSELPVIVGNPASLAIGLCAIAVWCIIKDRYGALGAACLGIGLLVKPHDVLLVWLYFLLVGGTYRRRALQAALIAAVIGIPVILWTTHVSPQWAPELRATLTIADAPGGINDPGPRSPEAHGLAMVIHLQSAISLFRDEPRIYNLVSYLICGTLLCAWTITTLRIRATPRNSWIALASVSALTMLPVYHRACDAKLLMLAVPACAMLWSDGSRIGKWALFFTASGFICTADLTWLIVLELIRKLQLPPSDLTRWMVEAVQVLPAPLSLLAVGVFYLWVYLRRTPETMSANEAI